MPVPRHAPLAVAAALALAVAGCGERLPEPTTTATGSAAATLLPNIAQIQDAVAGTAASHYPGKMTAYCPSEVPQLQGETFTCIVVSSRGRVFEATVTVAAGTQVTYVVKPR